MNKLSTTTESHQQSFSTEVNQSGSEESRKSLILQLNPKTQLYFANVDFDYSELFLELSVFLDSQKEGSSSQLNQEKKKNFFVRNYERVLIHFFQFLFDFELKTLQFEQKYETIASFAEWLQNQVIFKLPQQISLLNKKKNEQKKLKEKNNPSQIKNDPKRINSPKRSFDKMPLASQKYEISKMQSPRKLIFIEKEYQPSSFGAYDEATNHTIHYTPKQNQGKNEKKIIQKQNVQVKSKRKILKVKQTQIQKSQPQKQPTTINKRKQCYTLKPNFKQKTGRLSSIQKVQSLQTQGKKKPQTKSELQRNTIAQISTTKQPQIIVLQSSGEQKPQQPAYKTNSCEIISILQCSIIEQTSPSVLEQQKPTTKPKNKSSIGSYRQELIQLECSGSEMIQGRIKQNKQNSNNQAKTQPINIQGSQHIGNLIEDIKISCQLDHDNNNNNQYQHVFKQRQQRRLHNFRSRLSGVFRYPEKRFYIFPDMAEQKEDNVRNSIKAVDCRSTSSTVKGTKRNYSKEKRIQ